MPKTIRVPTQISSDIWQTTDVVVPDALATAAAAFTKASVGVTTLLAATPVTRAVTIVVTITEVFADGDGTQPTFSVGEEGSASKFAATSKFTAAAATATFVFAGTLTAGKKLTVTAVAGTGATETGALSVSVLAVAQ